jgi:hypothetical protein
MVVRVWLWLLDLLKVNFALHKKIILWFWLLVAVGIVIGIIAIPQQGIVTSDINSNFIDQNINHSVAVNSSIGSFIWGRLITIFLPLLLLFLFCIMSNVTALIVFPFMALQGYWLVMTVWWTMNKYALGSIMLLGFYAVWLVLVLQVLIAAVVWVMKMAAAIRRLGFRCGFSWHELSVGIGVIVGIEISLAAVEYLVYWVFLARIIY